MSGRIELVRQEPVTVEIPEEMREKFEALADTHNGRQGREWTPEEDAMILEYYLKKNKETMAEPFHCTSETLRKRYNKLIAMEENNGLDT